MSGQQSDMVGRQHLEAAGTPSGWRSGEGWNPIELADAVYAIYYFRNDHEHFYVDREETEDATAPPRIRGVYAQLNPHNTLTDLLERTKSRLTYSPTYTSLDAMYRERNNSTEPPPPLIARVRRAFEDLGPKEPLPAAARALTYRTLIADYVDCPKKEYCVYMHRDTIGCAVAPLWLVGYNIRTRAEAFYRNMELLIKDWGLCMHGDFSWADEPLEAIARAMDWSFFVLGMEYGDDEGAIMGQCARLSADIYRAYSQYPTSGDLHDAARALSEKFRIRNSLAPPDLAREAEWLITVALREY